MTRSAARRCLLGHGERDSCPTGAGRAGGVAVGGIVFLRETTRPLPVRDEQDWSSALAVLQVTAESRELRNGRAEDLSFSGAPISFFSPAYGKCGEDAGELGIQPRVSPGRGRSFRHRCRIAHQKP